MKTRIRKVVNGMGETFYIPEHRFLWIWWRLDSDSETIARFPTLLACQQHIDEILARKLKRIMRRSTKSDIIEYP